MLINSMADRLQQQRLQAGTVGGSQVSSWKSCIMRRMEGGESRGRAQSKLSYALQQLSGVCCKPVKPPDSHAFNWSEMLLAVGETGSRPACAVHITRLCS